MSHDGITERLQGIAEEIYQYYYESKISYHPEIKQWADLLYEIAEELQKKDNVG